MADEIARGVVSLSVEGLGQVNEAAAALDRFASLNAKAALQQTQSLELLTRALGGLGAQASQVDRLTVSLERLAAAQRLTEVGTLYTPGGTAARDQVAQTQALARAQQAYAAESERIAASEERAARTRAIYSQRSNRYSSAIGGGVGYNPYNLSSQFQGNSGAILGQAGGGGGYGGGAYNRLSGAADDFGRGFRGLRDRPYAEQLGQTFKFATFYGAAYGILFQLGTAFSNAAQEAVKFQDALNELNVVTGKTNDENKALADSLGSIAARTGASPSEGVAAGARAIGLFGLTQSDAATQAAAARSATRVSTQIALGSNRPFEQIQADIGAIAQAYGTGYQGQSRIADLDAYITRRFGVTVGNTLETTAQVGTLGRAQGFTLADSTAIAAALQARTGQSPSAVAGFLSQIYGKGSDPALQAQLQGVGVDPNKNLKEQLQQLVQLRAEGKVTDDQINSIADKVSKGKAGNAFRALVDDYQRIIDAANEADRNSQGEGQRQAEKRLSNVAGQLAEFSGAVANFGKDSLSTGLLDAFGALIVTFRSILNALDPLLQAFNSLPQPVRDATLALVALSIAAKGFGGFQASIARAASSGPANLIGRADRAGYAVAQDVRTRGLQFIPDAQRIQGGLGQTLATYERLSPAEQAALGLSPGARTVAQQTGSTLRPVAGVGAREALGRGAAGLALGAAGAELAATLLNPITIAIGGLVAIGAIKGKMDELSQAIDDSKPALENLGKARTADEFKNAANAVRASAKAVSEGRSGADGFFAGTFNPSSAAKEKTLFAQADYADAAGAAIAADEARAAALKSVSIFGDPATRTIETITDALKSLATNGASAREQLKLLYKSLIPQQGKGPIDIARASVAANLSEALTSNPFEFQNVPNFTAAGRGGGRAGQVLFPGESAPAKFVRSDAIASLLPQQQKAIFEAIQKSLPKQAEGGILNDAQIQSVSTAVINSLGVDITSINGAKEQIAAFIRQYLSGKAIGAGQGNTPLAASDLLAEIQQAIKPQFEQSLQDIQALGDPSKALPLYQEYIAKLKAARAYSKKTDASGDFSQINQIIREAEVGYARAQVDNLEELRKAAQSRATSKEDIKRIGRSYFNREGEALAKAGDVSGLVGIMGNANRSAIKSLLADLEASARLKRQAAIDARRIAAAAANLSAAVGSAGEDARDRRAGGGLTPQEAAAKAAADAAKAADDAVKTANKAAGRADAPAKGGNYDTGGDSSNPLGDKGSGSSGPTKAQIAAARAQAYATRRGGGIAEATAALVSAKADMAAAKKGTVEFYSALGAYFSAQNSLRDALREYQTNQALLGGDISDPVFQARVKLDEARKKLRQDRARGAGRDVIAQDRLDVRQAQLDAEAAKFQQRFSDAQTAERLGRISHAAYIQYLENEHKRLNAIKNRTRQQQEQLDQIDLALKDAKDAFAGQFNIGDIKLPTPYEVRRYIKAQADGLSYQGGQGGSSITVNYQIDGTDIGLVIKVLTQYLGSAAGRTGTSVAKKG